MDIAPYGRPAVKPPKIETGDLVKVTELNYRMVEGQYGPQYQFEGEIENGYKVRAWVKKYDKPTVNTKIYKLCTLIDRHYGEYSKDLDAALSRLLSFGKVYFKCSGHREVEDVTYPKFNVYVDKLPSVPPMQMGIDPLKTKANEIVNLILKKKPKLTVEAVTNLISQEIYTSKGELSEHEATITVARNLGIDMENSGIKVK